MKDSRFLGWSSERKTSTFFWFCLCVNTEGDNKRVSSFSIRHKIWTIEFPGIASSASLQIWCTFVMATSRRPLPQTKLALWSSHCSEIWNLNGRGNENDIDWGYNTISNLSTGDQRVLQQAIRCGVAGGNLGIRGARWVFNQGQTVSQLLWSIALSETYSFSKLRSETYLLFWQNLTGLPPEFAVGRLVSDFKKASLSYLEDFFFFGGGAV